MACARSKPATCSSSPIPIDAVGDVSAPERALAWLTLVRASNSAVSLRRLIESHGNAPAVLAAGASAWRAAGLSEASIEALRKPDPGASERDRVWLGKAPNHVVGWDDPDYPALLRRIPSPPACLFVVGEVAALWQPQIAIVGSRSPSAGGRDNARAFATAFAGAGLTVTSGLASGIDGAAHAGALDAGGHTVAVMATGPDRVYPPGHRDLATRIAHRGALVSEFAPGTEARREHFPSRNRIIAGLALGTLVVEAAERSGALITARLAGDAGREVFAIPGSIHNPVARGCHRLIRQGAALVESADEVIAALGPLASELADALRTRLHDGEPPPLATAKAGHEADPAYRQVLDALAFDPVGIDQLAERTGLTIAALSSMLLIMEMEGLVSAGHGRYSRRA
ncbi:MAG: DNA-protecting protein DprA [Gammaproteobacteria bacterium HGW-Gammaproteobacteria-4]|nr:MAG: DNA-protecting protein DprA [Gammaproteobacteria bacterium HGW-Gammaproteobacteria-4]